jgi:hypothetical protein
MLSASWLAGTAATACLAGCASGGAARPAELSRPAITSTATPTVAAVAAPSPRPAGRAPSVEDRDTERHARRSQLATAHAVVQAFFETYVAYLSGRLPAERVADVSPALRAQLEAGRAETTPAERASHPRIGRVSVATAGPPVSVTAVAIIEAGPSQRSQLTATLEPAGRTWRVVVVGG